MWDLASVNSHVVNFLEFIFQYNYYQIVLLNAQTLLQPDSKISQKMNEADTFITFMGYYLRYLGNIINIGNNQVLIEIAFLGIFALKDCQKRH